MVQLAIEPADQEILADVLEGYLTRLRFEISNTESIDFRNRLNHREDVILEVLESLGRTSSGYPDRAS